MTRRPSKIKVLDIDYAIVWVDDTWSSQTGSSGQQSYARQEITVQKAAPQIEANTLLHEILHAVADGMSLTDDSSEEEFVSRLATGMCAVWRDNPKVWAWWQQQVCYSKPAKSKKRT